MAAGTHTHGDVAAVVEGKKEVDEADEEVEKENGETTTSEPIRHATRKPNVSTTHSSFSSFFDSFHFFFFV
jgi:hypothetical protein